MSGGEQGTARAGTPGCPEVDELWELVQAGRQAGKLTAEEITLVLDEQSLDTAQIDEFYGVLEELHIEVVPRARKKSRRSRSTSTRRTSRPTRSSSS